MNIRNTVTDTIDLFNLQAIEILERAGILDPSEKQITTIENLLKIQISLI